MYSDIYGAWRVEFRPGWMQRKKFVPLEVEEVERVKQALRSATWTPAVAHERLWCAAILRHECFKKIAQPT